MLLNHLTGIATQPLTELAIAQIKELQQALDSLGYDCRPIDGIAGNQTHYAWRRFKEDNYQKDFKLIGAGSVSVLQSKLTSVAPSNPTINWRNGSQKISRHFTVAEVTQNDNRRIPTETKIIDNILALAKELDKIRDDWGKPIGVTSWYRPPAVNQAVGGAKNSQHLNGSAADIYPIGGNVTSFQQWLDKRWNKALGYGAKKGFVHVDLRPGKIRWDY